MTKQLNLDLAAALEDAQQGRDDGEMLIVRAGSAYMKVKAFNAGKHAAALRKIRKPRISKAAEHRIFPAFIDGMSTAQYVRAYERLNAKFVREEMRHWEYEGPFFGASPYEGLNESPCALYENGALDFDVIEEIDADDAQSVAAPEVQSAPVAAVDSLYSPGTPDPKNSAALPELGGFRPGDVVDVDGRTIGRSTIELVFLRKLAGFEAEPLARIVGASGKRLDVQLFQLTRVEAPAAEIVEQSPPVAASPEVSPPCGDIAPAAFAVLTAQARQARQMARDAVARAQASARDTRPTEPRTTQAPAALARAKTNDAKRQERHEKRQAKRKELKEQIHPSQQIAPAIGPSLFSDPRSGAPVVVPNKATADAMARSKQLSGKVAVRKATPAELADQRNTFVGYNPGEDRRMGYVLEMLQPQRKERSGY